MFFRANIYYKMSSKDEEFIRKRNREKSKRAYLNKKQRQQQQANSRRLSFNKNSENLKTDNNLDHQYKENYNKTYTLFENFNPDQNTLNSSDPVYTNTNISKPGKTQPNTSSNHSTQSNESQNFLKEHLNGGDEQMDTHTGEPLEKITSDHLKELVETAIFRATFDLNEKLTALKTAFDNMATTNNELLAAFKNKASKEDVEHEPIVIYLLKTYYFC